MADAPTRTAPRTCPGCQSLMQVFLAGEVRLDRCFFCGGFYFDRGELSAVAGRALEPAAGGTEGSRKCAGCGGAMQTSSLESVTVDACASCGGVYLDDGEIERLAGEVHLVREEKKAPAGSLTFRCPGCGDVFDTDLGVTTAHGLACARCAPGMSAPGSNLLAATRTPVTLNKGDPGSAEIKTLSLAANLLHLFGLG